MNPEFQRQLWLQFSPTRLALMPAMLVLFLVPFAIFVSDSPFGPLASVCAALFLGLTCVMGTFAVAASVADEFVEHTWDQQRMSAMGPWTMTWGKLLGAASYGWYGGALCMVVGAVTALASGITLQILCMLLVLGVLAALFLHASVLAVNLESPQVGTRLRSRGGMGVVMLLGLWLVTTLMQLSRLETIEWWGFQCSSLSFALVSLLLFAVCALVAAWRAMAASLAVPQVGWGWPALALVVASYGAGFVDAEIGLTPVLRWIAIVFVVSNVFTYVAVLSESQTRPRWARLIALAKGGNWRATAQSIPRWVTTLALAAVFGLLDNSSFVLHGMELGYLPPVLLLLLVRDCAVVLFFGFSSKGNRQGLAILLTLLVAYGLLPFLFSAIQAPTLLAVVLPVFAKGPLGLVYAALQTAVALGLLHWRWKSTALTA
jgi:hypothetical protein